MHLKCQKFGQISPTNSWEFWFLFVKKTNDLTLSRNVLYMQPKRPRCRRTAQDMWPYNKETVTNMIQKLQEKNCKTWSELDILFLFCLVGRCLSQHFPDYLSNKSKIYFIKSKKGKTIRRTIIYINWTFSFERFKIVEVDDYFDDKGWYTQGFAVWSVHKGPVLPPGLIGGLSLYNE